MEKITSRHYYTEEELKTLLGLSETTEIELIKTITDHDIEENKDLEEYKCEITTVETIDYDDKK